MQECRNSFAEKAAKLVPKSWSAYRFAMAQAPLNGTKASSLAKVPREFLTAQA
jgi:hypothetical protein